MFCSRLSFLLLFFCSALTMTSNRSSRCAMNCFRFAAARNDDEIDQFINVVFYSKEKICWFFFRRRFTDYYYHSSLLPVVWMHSVHSSRLHFVCACVCCIIASAPLKMAYNLDKSIFYLEYHWKAEAEIKQERKEATWMRISSSFFKIAFPESSSIYWRCIMDLYAIA